MRLAVIPARGGSKRIPRKNIKMFAGKPMIAHAITAAKSSGLFEHVVVSTDDREIAEIATEWGAEVPFTRPKELADDHTPTVPVIAHAILACEALGWRIDLACCIYPGVPFIQTNDLKGALALLENSAADYSFPVTEFPSAIQRALKRNGNGRMSPFYPQYELTRTQDLEPAYHDAGQFYWGSADAWKTNMYLHSSGVGYLIPNWRVVDIDTPDDWQRAEIIYNAFFLARTHE
ncbi:pseudaminic acid cytidylyltransferase [Thiobacillus sp.]|jgi:pseudaminic acid cytidylyltransferase|uniref:pseudaminic acid cytidylyltransferase n=1 Tax=Thiobacillus sp. TaxID=924 RepID=UPI0025E5F9E7|nr:pseudaminic acid cytidylyltransferase [Thiobacillus sp.]